MISTICPANERQQIRSVSSCNKLSGDTVNFQFDAQAACIHVDVEIFTLSHACNKFCVWRRWCYESEIVILLIAFTYQKQKKTNNKICGSQIKMTMTISIIMTMIIMLLLMMTAHDQETHQIFSQINGQGLLCRPQIEYTWNSIVNIREKQEMQMNPNTCNVNRERELDMKYKVETSLINL